MDRLNDRANEQALVQINCEDILISLGWQNIPILRQLAARIFTWPARLFARQVLDYDQGVAEHGLAAGSQRLLSTYIQSLEVHGQQYVPTNGPLLILSNHPGMTDTVALFASLPRTDLKILAAERPFLRALPATSEFLFYIPETGPGRMEIIRQTARYLRSGGAVLTFPGGSIEPDPAVMSGAAEKLDHWSNSIGVFVRMVPGLQLTPVMVSGVISPEALKHPLTRLRRLPKDRERMAATLQILAKIFFPSVWPVTVRVDIFPPLSGETYRSLHDPEQITAAVIENIRPFYRDFIHPGKV